jgi:hypothetical protein
MPSLGRVGSGKAGFIAGLSGPGGFRAVVRGSPCVGIPGCTLVLMAKLRPAFLGFSTCDAVLFNAVSCATRCSYSTQYASWLTLSRG